MKKFIILVVSAVVLLFVLFYGLLFTQPGNNFLKPTVESKINKTLKTNMKLEAFSLRPSFVLIRLKTPSGSTFEARGAFGLFSKRVNMQYNLDVNKNEDKFEFGQFKLKGPFWVKGDVKGFIKAALTITGKSDFAASDVTYKIDLYNLKPKSVSADIKNLELENLLAVLNQSKYANAQISANIKLTNLKKNALQGKVVIDIKNGLVNNGVMKKIYNINLPETTFSALSEVVLNGSFVNFSTNAKSNFGNSIIKGSYNQLSSDVKAAYNINIRQLSLLAPITNIQLAGKFSTQGNISGTLKKLYIKGKSGVADSSTTYDVVLKDNKPISVALSSTNARIDKLLFMLNKPVYAYGLANLDLKMTDLRPKNLDGKLNINIQKGMLNTKVINKLYNMSMPQTTFKAKIGSVIKKSVAASKIDIASSIGFLSTDKTVFDIAKSMLNSDYKLIIPNLDKLYFVTNKHLRGAATVTGDVKYNKQGMIASAHSKMWHGNIDIKLINNKVTGKAKNIQVVELLNTLMLNKIFDSTGNVDFRYNLLTKKGTVDANFANGHILPNRATFLLRNMARFDITREIYKTTKIESRINNKKIYSNLDMVSRLTHITSKNAFMDLNRNFIDARVRVGIRKSAVFVNLKGNINHPRIKLDFKNLIRHKAKKKLKKLIKGLFK